MTPRPSDTVLLQENPEDLRLFREEAEYSDYLSVHVTGQHVERLEDGVVFYEIELHLSRQRWRVARRFSEFRALRQQLIKTLSHGRHRRQPRCAICENVLASILDTTFPSRHQWGSHLFSRKSSSSRFSPHEDDIIDERKLRFKDFVAMCLLTVRSLRQHIRVLSDSAPCQISVALRLIEEFFGLTFTRYLGFLSERGIVDQANDTIDVQQRLSQRRGHEHRAVSDASVTCRRR
ncbi:hypothetical protein BBJ28_00006169 [Nothophytophthora sp. Chile5]|nr:hypothetical protein BBJ28_00006169 [Nothophytophthora sp. Chile5]